MQNSFVNLYILIRAVMSTQLHCQIRRKEQDKKNYTWKRDRATKNKKLIEHNKM